MVELPLGLQLGKGAGTRSLNCKYVVAGLPWLVGLLMGVVSLGDEIVIRLRCSLEGLPLYCEVFTWCLYCHKVLFLSLSSGRVATMRHCYIFPTRCLGAVGLPLMMGMPTNAELSNR